MEQTDQAVNPRERERARHARNGQAALQHMFPVNVQPLNSCHPKACRTDSLVPGREDGVSSRTCHERGKQL